MELQMELQLVDFDSKDQCENCGLKLYPQERIWYHIGFDKGNHHLTCGVKCWGKLKTILKIISNTGFKNIKNGYFELGFNMWIKAEK